MPKAYRFYTGNKSVITEALYQANDEMKSKLIAQSTWLALPELPKANYRYWLTEKGKEMYDSALRPLHVGMFELIEEQEVDTSDLGEITFQNDYQIVEKYQNKWKGMMKHLKEKGKPVSPLLLKAMQYSPHHGKALDLGPGIFRDTEFLLGQGYVVDAVDMNNEVAELARSMKQKGFTFYQTSFQEFEYAKQTYSLINAQYALPFIKSKEEMKTVVNSIKDALIGGGFFCGQFFGINDDWNGEKTKLSFYTKEEVEELLSGLELIQLDEEEYDRDSDAGTFKHWHVFHVIARK